jgi:hypothetical protein
MTRSLRLIVGTVIAAATVGLAWLTPVILAGVTFNGID